MDIKVHFKAGGSFVGLPPQLSTSAESVFVAWKNQILGYSVKTGALFAEFKGIKDTIVGFGLHYSGPYECITACSSSGEVITWRVVTFFKVLNKKLDKGNIMSFHVIQSDPLKAFLSFRENSVICFNLFDLEKELGQPYGLTLAPHLFHLDVCSNNYFAVTQKSALHVVKFKDFLKTYSFGIDAPREFTCIACHPEQEIILTGDNTGRVVMWQNIFYLRPAKAVYHWHTLPVRTLAFSTIGSYFYSGGNESVLVRWQLDNHFEKKFLPRLASTIAQIRVALNNKFIAISTDDNAIRIVDSQFDSVSLIQHLVIGNSFESGIVLDPKSKALVMNGNIGQIQFYSFHDNSLLYNVDIVGQNKISNERSCKIENTQVRKIAISKNSLWMATVEMRKDSDYAPEIRLKFWLFDTTIQNFKLNTSIEDPHTNQVHAIAFQPTDNMDELKLVSVGGDKKFRVWYLTETGTDNSKTIIWKCLCVGFYHNFFCKSLSFSIDGSLIAVSFENIVTVWQPDICNLKCSFIHPICKEEVTHVEFGKSNQCHLLVVATKSRLSVWNLLTLTMMWTVPVDVSFLLADSVTTNMAIITKDRTVYVFTPMSPEPVFSSDKLLRKYNGICAAAFVPAKYCNDAKLRWYQRSGICFINNNSELFYLGCDDIESAETSNMISELGNSLFSMTLPKTQVDKNKSKDPIMHLYSKDIGQKNIKKYLEASVQTMIPIRLMCGSLLRSMVHQKEET